MKKFKLATAVLSAAVMAFATATTTHAIAIIDEEGNIIQENEILEGGIVPMMGELDLGDFDLGGDIAFYREITARFNEEWISEDNNFRLRFGEETEIVFEDGQPFTGEIEELIGRNLTVRFSISHRDIPETIPNPYKVTILFEQAVHLLPELILEETDWSAYQIIVTKNGVNTGVPNATAETVGDYIFPNYVPLRAITEVLGYIPEWNAERREVVVYSPRGRISFRIDLPYYAVVGENGTSTYNLDPPLIINDRTYVPLAFFRIVFGFEGAYFSSGQVHIRDVSDMA